MLSAPFAANSSSRKQTGKSGDRQHLSHHLSPNEAFLAIKPFGLLLFAPFAANSSSRKQTGKSVATLAVNRFRQTGQEV